jgi:hypothetical protein
MSRGDTNFEFDLKWTANSMYGASIDTVSYFAPSEEARPLKRHLPDGYRDIPLPPRHDGKPGGAEKGAGRDRCCCWEG